MTETLPRVKASVLDPDATDCVIGDCPEEAVNLVTVLVNVDPTDRREVRPKNIAKCRKHTHPLDVLFIGPGPL